MEARRFIKTASTSQVLIDLPASLVNRKLEILVIPLDEPETPGKTRKRRPPVELAGKVRELGDVMSSAPASDWGIDEP